MTKKRETLQDGYNNFIDKLFEKILFLPAKELHQIIIERFKTTPENSRKIVSRAVAKKIISSTSPFKFGNGQYVYFRNTYSLTFDDIKNIVEVSRPPVFRLLQLLEDNDGIISYFEALKITAAPHEESTSKISSLNDIIRLLDRLDLVYEKRDQNDNAFILLKLHRQVLSKYEEKNLMTAHYQKMITDCNLIPDILNWLTNSNIIDNLNLLYRNKNNPGLGIIHNNLYWDACAYTKSTGINPIFGAQADVTEKQTLVVLDVVLSTDYTHIHLDAFIERIQININSVKVSKRKTLPIIIYRDCSKEVFFTMRKNGIISFSISAIFGTKIIDIVKRISQLPLLLKENQNLDQSVESILKTIKSSGQDGALKDLRGTLFEYLMFPYLKFLYPNATFEQNKILKIKDRKHEFDYIITSSHPPEIIFVELKGLRDGSFIPLGDNNKKATLVWFFKKSMALAKEYYKNRNDKNYAIKAIFITTADYWSTAMDFIEQMNNSSFQSQNSNVVIARKELLENLAKKGFNNEIRMIDKYYSKIEDESQNFYYSDEISSSDSHNRSITEDFYSVEFPEIEYFKSQKEKDLLKRLDELM
jgi:hypothetical protein